MATNSQLSARWRAFYQHMLIARVQGTPALPLTPETDANPLNPNRSGGAGRSGAGANTGSNRAPQRAGPALRLVWNAPSHE
jgi:hypothetical protein